MAKEVFSRDLPHLNVGTFGHVDHGKTSLAAGITLVLSQMPGYKAENRGYGEIDSAPEERQRGITISTSHLEYSTPKRHYSHVDCPGHQDYIKNMITGAAQVDVAIVVVAAPDGAMLQTKEHLRLLYQIGVRRLVVFINKVDMIEDSEMLLLVEEEVLDEAKKHGFDEANIVFIQGSARCALEGTRPEIGREAILKLMEALDAVPQPERRTHEPFLMAIEGINSIPGRGTVVTGLVDRGRLKVGEQVQVLGLGMDIETKVTGLETYCKTLDYAEAGENVGALLQSKAGLKREDFRRGMVLCAPGSVKLCKSFVAEIYVLTEKDGGRKKPFRSGYKPQFFIRTADVTGSVELLDGRDMALPGENVRSKIELMKAIVVEKDMRFPVREGGHTVAQGIVTEVLD